MHEAASFGAVTFATGIAGETAAGILFVFTVSSFCTSAPEEREEKPRNRAFGYVAKSDALSRSREKTASRRRSFEKEAFLTHTPKKSTWGFSERDDTRLRAQMRTEVNRRGRGAEKRAEAKQRGPKEGAGASRAESKGGKRSDALQAASARRVEAEVALGFRGISRTPNRWNSPAATPPERQPSPDMYAHGGKLRCTIAPTSSMQGCPSCDKRAVG